MSDLAAAPDTPLGSGKRAGWIAWVLLAPLIVWLLIFVVAPTAIMLVYSFSENGEHGSIEHVFTTRHYARIGAASDLGNILLTGTLRTVLSFPLVLAVSAAVAAVIGWFREQTDTLAGGIAIFVGAMIVCTIRAMVSEPGGSILLSLIIAASCGTACLLIPARVLNRWPPILVLPIVTVVILFLFEARAAAMRSSATYVKVFVESIDYAALSTAICVFIGYPAAYCIGRSSPRLRNLLLVGVMIPFWANFLIRTYAWFMILSHDGLLNTSLIFMGVFDKPHEMLFTPGAVMVGLVYTYLPFMILPIYGSVEKLDESMIEASFDLGANPLRTFARVILPLTWPGIAAGILLVFIPAIGQFAINDLLGGKREPIIGNVIENQFGAAMNKPFGAALGMVLLAGFAASVLLNRRRPEGA